MLDEATPANLSITIFGETKIFHDKTKFIQYLSTNPQSPTKDNRWKMPTQEVKLHPRKARK